MLRSAGFRLVVAMLAGAAMVVVTAPAAIAQTPPDDSATSPEPSETVPDTVPDDTGIVDSWALAPGDANQTGGQRPNLSYELSPGGEVKDNVTVYNLGTEQLTFAVYATDAFNNDDGSFNLLAGDDKPTDVGTWVTMPVNIVAVPAGKAATIPIEVHVPIDARPGDHVGAIVASSPTVGSGQDNATITLDRRTGTRLYVRVAGQLHPELAVEDLSTTYGSSANPAGGSADIKYRIVNRGNVRLEGKQKVSVSGPLGLLEKSAATADIPELLPGESMEVEETIDGVPATGVLMTHVDIEPASPAGGDALEPTKHTSSIMALPYTVIAALLVLILALLARRAFRRHRDADIAELIDSPRGEVVEAEVVEHQGS